MLCVISDSIYMKYEQKRHSRARGRGLPHPGQMDLLPVLWMFWYIYGPADSLEVKRTLITVARHDRWSHVAGLHSTKRIPHQSRMDTQQRGRKSKSHPIVR